MKLDNYWSFIIVCPDTGAQVSRKGHAYSGGVCPACGDLDASTFTHCVQKVGRWERPSLVEWMAGKRKIFHQTG